MLNKFGMLNNCIKGDVHSDYLHRYMLSTDGSIFRKEPACVVYPKNAQDVIQTVDFAREHSFTIHPRGAGSGLCGSSLGSGIVIDFTKYMNQLFSIDLKNKTFECEPGFRFGQLEAELKGKKLFFPPDPSSGEYASFGGMYGTNASGAHSVKYGNVSDYILDAQVVLANGQLITLSEIQAKDYENLPENISDIFQNLWQMYMDNNQKIEKSYPDIRYNVAGYNLRGLVRDNQLVLNRLFAGAEGTLGIVTRLKFKLIDKPEHDNLVVAFFDDIVSASKAVQMILPMKPSGIEVMDKSLLNLARQSDKTLQDKIPQGIDNVLLIEFDENDIDKCTEQADKAKDIIKKEKLTDKAYLAVSVQEKQKFWAVRKAAVPILYKLKGEKKILALIEDAVVPTDCLVEYFKGIYKILNRHKVDFVTYGHIAKGLLHTRPLLNMKDVHDIGMLKVLADEVFDLVHLLGGSVSGEHGDGRLRSTYIKQQYPEIYDLFLETKDIFDPDGLFNPEIKTTHDPDQMTKSLRFGTQYKGSDLKEKNLNWPQGFIQEAEKCHGCSKCTTMTTATRMCPVYKFTCEESAAPKAKANILRALISGAVEDSALYKARFQQVIEKCVNCGSCYKECPSEVNIPKLAIEARAQFVKRFGVSLENRLLTSAEFAGANTGKFSELLKPVMEMKISRKAAEKFTGISAARDIVSFSSQSLFKRIQPKEGNGKINLIYFAGCYAGYIRPETGLAAIKVLKQLNMNIYTPKQHCCGLPMLSKGMTKQAAEKIYQNLAQWRNLIDRADYIVVTCSSCGLSLMQEWEYLVDTKEIQAVKEKIIHISSLINLYMERLDLKPCKDKVAYHNPCHLRVQPFAQSSLNLLSKIPGLETQDLNSHCCGMAGAWGMSAKNFDLSRNIGSDMITKLNNSNATTGVTDCPTCRIQMEQFGQKPVKHPVEILAGCL
ncbi:anaerobic glycerol-3-phosphate dehydrogenase subunit C [Desulfobacterales bacterium HSG17]|nr:anaerobic glycerol-3-phosphate dehydrogenase subunit C [Desulfobacterales bacterium HSG17]